MTDGPVTLLARITDTIAAMREQHRRELWIARMEAERAQEDDLDPAR